MIRELRRRLLLRAFAAAKRYAAKNDGLPQADSYVAGWLAGWRAARLHYRNRIEVKSETWGPAGGGGIERKI